MIDCIMIGQHNIMHGGQVERYRTSELLRMRECFSSPWYHDARRRFVYKVM